MSAEAESRTAIAPSQMLEGKVSALRTRIVLVALGTGAALAGAAFISLIVLEMLVDWYVELPWALRLIWFLGALAAVIYLINEHVIIPLLDTPNLDGTALLVERHFPKFGTRLIATLQLTRPGALHGRESPLFVEELVKQTEEQAQDDDFTQIVSTDPLKRSGLALLSCLIIAAGVLLGGGLTADALLKRAFLSVSTEVPRKTRVASFTGDLTIGRGDPVLFQAQAEGVIPEQGTVSISFDSGISKEFVLDKAEESATYTRRLESVQESFTYVIYLNDGRSKQGTVNVVPRPTVAKMAASQTFPEYTHLGTTKRSLADLSLLSGSRLGLEITANKNIAQGYIQLYGITNQLPLTVSQQDPAQVLATISIPATNLTGFSVHLTDEHGLHSRDEAIYRIDVLPDRVPQVKILYPERREELITQKARMLISFEALDDFGIAKVMLKHQFDGGETNTVDLDLGKATERLVKRRYDWRIGDFDPLPSEGSAIEYWIEVHDNNDVTGPGIARTDRYVARIVSEQEKRQDLLNRVGDSLSSIGEATTDQEVLNQRLGELIKARAAEAIKP
ncbi:MAG: hypothetical protein ACPGVU_21720 [Limisphaerales bacterium]